MSELSIVTVAHESAAKIEAFVDCARRAAPWAEIVVVDNASTDETRELVEAAGASVKLISAKENLGFGRGCNLGSLHASGVWLLFANPDVLLKSVSVPTGGSGEGFGLGAGLIATAEQASAVPGARAELTQAEDWLEEVWKLFIPRSLSRHLVGRRHPIAWPIGGMFIAHRDEYRAIGGFDPRYFLFFEDRDLGRRYRQAGLPVKIVGGLEGVHWAGSSSANISSWRREAWSIISWIEYTAVWRGSDQAAFTAANVLRVLNRISGLAQRPRLSERVRSKAHRAGLIAKFVVNFDEFLPSAPQSYYPHARCALASATGSEVA
jgi:N-acetylglucosaminyl-diphospho-decaprenol L-rhamnosyltransferase